MTDRPAQTQLSSGLAAPDLLGSAESKQEGITCLLVPFRVEHHVTYVAVAFRK